MTNHVQGMNCKTLKTMPEHPFYTLSGEWIDAADLIRNLDGGYGEVDGMRIVEREQAMFNLTVDEAHTFFVGDGQWLVHNTCQFRRFGSEIEALQAAETGQLELPTSGTGNRQEKWIAEVGAIGETASFGDNNLFTHRMDISTSGKALGWLERNAVDYDAWRDAIDNGLGQVARVDGTLTDIRNVLVVTKTNEPGRYGLTSAGLGLFNRNITDISAIRIR